MIKEIFLFFGARIFSGIFEILGLPLLVYLGLNQKIYGIEGAVAKIIISVIVIVSNYFFSKFVIFKKSRFSQTNKGVNMSNIIKTRNSELKYTPIIPPSIYGKVIISALFLLFFLVTSYKLTNASLWFDEGVEYLVSIAPLNKMIGLINKTMQPPLYNFLMHFLLKFSVTEYWFRFTSVIFGFLGCVGLYASVNEMRGWKTASVAIFFYTFLRNSVYYNQECAEYALLICVLFWTIYFFICLLNQYSDKKAVLFTVFCILSAYSQYGAVFPLLGLSLSLFAFYLINREWIVIKKLTVIMGTAVITFGTILYYCFLRVQRGSVSASVKPFNNLFEELQNFINGIKTNFSFFFTTFYSRKRYTTLVELLYLFAVFAVIWSVFQKNNKKLRFVGVSAIITYILFFIGERSGIYTNGAYSSMRHALAILPVLLISIMVSIDLIFNIVQTYIKKINPKLSYISAALVVLALSLNNYKSWLTIEKNWNKEDVRSALNLWVNETGGMEDIYLYYAAVPVFSLYAENLNLNFGKQAIIDWGIFGGDPTKTQYKYFRYGENLRGRDINYTKESINKSFNNKMPDNLWFLLSHIFPDSQVYMDAFSEMGYGYQVYRWDDGRLLWLYNYDFVKNNHLMIMENSNLSEIITGIDQMTQNLNGDNSVLFRVEGNDPKIYLTPHLIKYDDSKAHIIVVEFLTEYNGNLQLFFMDGASTDFSELNSVRSQYIAGQKRVMVKLPPEARLDFLRLDIDNANVPFDTENNIILSNIKIFEIM